MRARHSLVLDNGQVVGYGWTVRYGYIRVRFAKPDKPGQYVEATTGVVPPNGWTPKKSAPAACVRAAKEIIERYHAERPKGEGWDRAMQAVERTSGLRPDTFATYSEVVTQLRRLVPEIDGPADLTPESAQRFKRLYATTTYRRSKKDGAKEFVRTPQTVVKTLRHLSALWSVHFRELGYVKDNPWTTVARPDVPKKAVVIPAEESFAKFFGWLNEKFGGWELIDLFVKTKAYAGCRTLDLCSAKSADLDGDVLTLHHTKTKVPRPVQLPTVIADGLHRIKGATWLWEQYPVEAAKRWPSTIRRRGFEPRTFRNAIKALFRAYNAANPAHKIKPHDFRKRAVTLATLATASVDDAADAVGLDPRTARRYYNDASKSLKGRELLLRMADVLLPKEAAK